MGPSYVEVVDRAGLGVPAGLVVRLVEAVLAAEGTSGTVVVAFVDEAEMAELNSRYRGLQEPTDVLAFRYAEDDSEWPEQLISLDEDTGSNVEGSAGSQSPLDLGEVAVCAEVVRRYAEEDQEDPGCLLAWAIMHGVLHLLGYDHERDEGEMRHREQVLLEELDKVVQGISFPQDG